MNKSQLKSKIALLFAILLVGVIFLNSLAMSISGAPEQYFPLESTEATVSTDIAPTSPQESTVSSSDSIGDKKLPIFNMYEPKYESSELIEDTIPEEPSEPSESSEPSDPYVLESIGTFKLTAYCPCTACSGPWGNNTDSGVIAQPNHTVAVDKSVITYGTKLYINGIVYTAEDCGSSVKGNIIDIFFNTHEEVDEFGLQYAEIYIVKDAD